MRREIDWREGLFRALATMALLASAVPEARAQVRPPLVWGAFVDGQAGFNKLVETTGGKKPGIIATFVELGPDLIMPQDMMKIALDNNSTLLIFLETKESNLEMMDEESTNYAKSLANNLKEYPGKVILVPMPEMNGDSERWDKSDPKNTPETFINAYRMIRQQFNDVPNVKFGWAVNETTDNIDPYYPGKIVDVVGTDGFNWKNNWRSPEQIFGSTLDQLKKYDKPVFIFSTASAEGKGKAEWMRQLFVMAGEKGVKAVLLFNFDKEENWAISPEDVKEVLP